MLFYLMAQFTRICGLIVLHSKLSHSKTIEKSFQFNRKSVLYKLLECAIILL